MSEENCGYQGLGGGKTGEMFFKSTNVQSVDNQ